MLLQYRAAAVAGFGTQLFWGLMRVMIFTAFYRSSDRPQPMTLEQTVTYLWLIQAMLMLLPWHIDAEIRDMIHRGTLAYELVRPTDLYWFWYSRNLAMRIAPLLLRSVPMFVMAGLLFGLRPPASPTALLMFLLAVVGALLLGAAITNAMSVFTMWTIAGDGLARLVGVLVSFLSGSIVPLPLFPEWSQPVVRFLPFRGLMDLPFRLYMGQLGARDAVWSIGHQLVWTAAIVLAGRWLLNRIKHRIVVQGG